MSFGAIPYKRAWYLDVVSNISEEMRPLIAILVELRNGNLECVRDLVPLLTHSHLDVRLYAQQLFTDVCSHNNTSAFNLALGAAKTLDETRRILFRMGQTLSLSVIPALLTWREELDNLEIDEYVYHALSTILPVSGINPFAMSSFDVREKYERAVAGLDSSRYYYRGKQLFVGDFTKELIVAATVAFKEGTKVNLFMQPQLLSNFSGKKCPIIGGQRITAADMNALLSYVEGIATMKWKAGVKYFFQHEVV